MCNQNKYKSYGNLLVTQDGRVWIKPGIEFPYFQRYNRAGEPSGYLFVRLHGQKDVAVHRLMGKTWLLNPKPGVFDRIDHKNQIKTDNRGGNLRWVNAWLNAINRTTLGCRFDYDVRLWCSSHWVRGREQLNGFFTTFLAAHEATKQAKERLFDNIYLGLLEKKNEP